jgi:hypothetical protein
MCARAEGSIAGVSRQNIDEQGGLREDRKVQKVSFRAVGLES